MRSEAKPDTLLISLDFDIADFVNPFLLKAKTGDLVKFKAINAEFSILIRNADKFFENVNQNIKIHLNEGEDSDHLIVKGDLPEDSEIKYEVYCITKDMWAEAPPRIIIVPHAEY